MALSNLATHKLIPPGSSDPRIVVVVGVILHVDAGNSESLYPYFNGPSGGVESHFFIKNDGSIEQYRDTNYEADANYRANSWVVNGRRHGFVSVETQGYGPGKWGPAQLSAIKRLILELSEEHNFPIRVAPGPFSPGVGYHTMWGSPSDWTPVAKSCPGPARITQFENILTPWFATADEPASKMDPDSYYVGATGAHVKWLGTRLVAHGFNKHGDDNGYQPGPVFSRYDKANVRGAQLANGVAPEDATGLPGNAILLLLSREPKHARKPTNVEAARTDIKDAQAALAVATDGGPRPRVEEAESLLARALKLLRRK